MLAWTGHAMAPEASSQFKEPKPPPEKSVFYVELLKQACLGSSLKLPALCVSLVPHSLGRHLISLAGLFIPSCILDPFSHLKLGAIFS